MISSVGSSLSALRAYGVKMAVTSNNIANMNTNEFKKSRALLKEGAIGNVEVEIDRIDTPGHPVIEVAGDQITEKESSNVDLAEEITETILTQRGYDANLIMIKTQEEMSGSIMDIIG